MPRNDWPKRPLRIAEGTFAAVIRAYLTSPIFKALAPKTQTNYRVLLMMAENPAALGGLSVLTIRPALVQAFLDGLAATPGRQKNARTALKAVEKFALVRDLLPYPILTGTETIKMDGGHEPWSDDMVRLAIEHARPDLARIVMLAVESGQRGSDITKCVVRHRGSDRSAHWRCPHRHPCHPEKDRRAALDPIHAGAVGSDRDLASDPPAAVLSRLRADGTPFDRNALSWAWNQERARNPALAPLEAAGLVVHGLRATAVVRARQRGATVLQISSMFGMSEPMVARYSRLADQREMAMAAVHHIDGTRQEQMRAKDLKTYS